MKQGFRASRQVNQGQTFKGEEKQNWEALFNQALALHQRGVEGDQQASRKAYELLVEIRRKEPRENIVEAYLGSTITLLGRDEKNPEERIRKVMEGLKMLDRAVSREGNNINIRILRAYVCFNLPQDIFHRISTAAGDFDYLLKRYQKDPSIFTASFYNQLRHDLSDAQGML